MRGIIKMSVIQGGGLNGRWGLVRQMGPWKPTSRDRVGAGYTPGNEDVIRPYVVRGDKPPPKLSKWGQNNVVSKKAYTRGISRPGLKSEYNSVAGVLKGIHSTLLGLGARGSGQGTSMGNNMGNGGAGNGAGGEDDYEDDENVERPGTTNLGMVQEDDEEFFEAVAEEEIVLKEEKVKPEMKEETRSYGLFPGHRNPLYIPKPEMTEVKRKGKYKGI